MSRIVIDGENIGPDEDFVWLDLLKRGEKRLSVNVKITDTPDGEMLVCEVFREPLNTDAPPLSRLSVPIEVTPDEEQGGT